MPRIVRFHAFGGPEVLKIENVDMPAPGKGEVRFKVKAIGLNRAEALFRAGQYLELPEFPSRIGYEAAGIVEAVGSDVKGISPGDSVSVVPYKDMSLHGVYGEEATVDAAYVVKHPANLSFEEAAASWMQYLTAYGALIEVAKMSKGDTVVITAASSSVGLAAIQLALYQGAIPIALTRTSQKKEALKKAGAHHVIATQEEDIATRIKEVTQNKGARIVFDPVGGKTVLALADGAAYNGILIEYGGLSMEHTPFPLITALRKGLTMRGYTLFELTHRPDELKKGIQFVSEGLANGKLKPIIAKTFPLDQIVESHRYMESNQQFGKIIVTVP